MDINLVDIFSSRDTMESIFPCLLKYLTKSLHPKQPATFLQKLTMMPMCISMQLVLISFRHYKWFNNTWQWVNGLRYFIFLTKSKRVKTYSFVIDGCFCQICVWSYFVLQMFQNCFSIVSEWSGAGKQQWKSQF